jgi:hypothetical protein
MMLPHALLYLLYLRQVVYYYDNVYKCLSTLSAYGNLASQSNFGWKNDKPPPTVIEGHPRLLAEGFEQLRVVRDYRTPRYALRVVRDYRKKKKMGISSSSASSATTAPHPSAYQVC